MHAKMDQVDQTVANPPRQYAALLSFAPVPDDLECLGTCWSPGYILFEPAKRMVLFGSKTFAIDDIKYYACSPLLMKVADHLVRTTLYLQDHSLAVHFVITDGVNSETYTQVLDLLNVEQCARSVEDSIALTHIAKEIHKHRSDAAGIEASPPLTRKEQRVQQSANIRAKSKPKRARKK